MKRILLLLPLLALVGCGQYPTHTPLPGKYNVPGDIYITTIGTHQYVIWEHDGGYAGMGGICHYEDCSNPVHLPCAGDTLQKP